ncbi:MBL fold metallo-hydrolase [Jeotgalibacillus soli]|uniref:Metallo-beta-lactamase domain-containing protein n=1 Tax=Jeotgalibacillus soli TaxID=889306 RepID=A0A0C2W5L9_9BACL|nr:MBL fold metallo-hydrolase [Jeotgalibacillus soli]KIL51876.1 hypothetical protein KP78_02460 [Jeotgalibacillus soli]
MEDKLIPVTSVASGFGIEFSPNAYMYTNQVVNLFFVGTDGGWVLIDAGMPKSAEKIRAEAEERFGKGSKPEAIILTHGHFDHVGGIEELVEWWDVPVYAHELELPFLQGKIDYPEPDSSVEGGMVAKMSPIFPNEAINLGSHVQNLPKDGSVPFMPGWKWIHTPGHTPGHISLFHEQDRILIAGDAFVAVKQEYLYKVITQELEISGPPRYFTTDWQAAWDSVRKLSALKPRIAATGHGGVMSEELLTSSLDLLVSEFETIAIPDYGRFVDEGTYH